MQPAPPGIRTFAPNSKHEQVMSIREQLEAGQFEEVCPYHMSHAGYQACPLLHSLLYRNVSRRYLPQRPH